MHNNLFFIISYLRNMSRYFLKFQIFSNKKIICRICRHMTVLVNLRLSPKGRGYNSLEYGMEGTAPFLETASAAARAARARTGTKSILSGFFPDSSSPAYP